MSATNVAVRKDTVGPVVLQAAAYIRRPLGFDPSDSRRLGWRRHTEQSDSRGRQEKEAEETGDRSENTIQVVIKSTFCIRFYML